MYPAEPLNETYDETESRRKMPEICSTLGYLDKLSQMKIEHVGKFCEVIIENEFFQAD